MNQAKILKNFRDFTELSLVWCIKEADLGTTRVTEAIEGLLKDIARLSKMSTDSLKALEGLQFMLKEFDQSNYKQLQTSLHKLSREHAEIDLYIQPVMEALQFQDRFRQNLENIVKMIDVWQEQRFDLVKGESALGQETLLAFGELLIAKTSMKRERDIVRDHIKGLAAESETPRMTLF